jgi:6-phosphogluconolactonase
MNNWKVFGNTQQLDIELAERIASCLKRDITQRGSASLAVSGGNTPRGMFKHLSNCELAWPKVDIILVDERWVALGSADSNERLVRDNLLQNKACGARLHSLKTLDTEPEAALGELNKRLEQICLPFSAVVLGMGGDGHTASWFPRASNLNELMDPAGSALLAVTDPVAAPHKRVTLTFPAVLNTDNIIIHITGEDKKSVLQGASDSGAPIAAILNQAKIPVSIWWAPK